MSLFTVNGIYYYNFEMNGCRYSKSTRKRREKDALDVESAARRLLLDGHQGVLAQEQRERERQTIAAATRSLRTTRRSIGRLSSRNMIWDASSA
jgi:hypothetical protein